MFVKVKLKVKKIINSKFQNLKNILIESMLQTMTTRRVRDIKNKIRFSLEPVHLPPDRGKAYIDVKKFYEEITQTWASGNTKIMNNYLIYRYFMYRLHKFIFFVLMEAIVLGQLYIGFNYKASIIALSLVGSLFALLILEFFKYFPENSLRINYPSYNDPDGGFWTDPSVKLKFQKKYFLILNATDVSDYDFVQMLEKSDLSDEEKDIAIKLKQDIYLGSVQNLIATSRLLAR